MAGASYPAGMALRDSVPTRLRSRQSPRYVLQVGMLWTLDVPGEAPDCCCRKLILTYHCLQPWSAKKNYQSTYHCIRFLIPCQLQ